jgi:hypothetical protein
LPAVQRRVIGNLMSRRLPLAERKSPLRGVLDLLSGAYPSFVVGGPVGRQLPVFHFHEVTPDYLEPHLLYLKENGYRTVTSEAVARWVREGVHPGERSVVLCFDDAWASAWTVAAPLLRRYGLRAITFAIPGRTVEADRVRPTLEDVEGAPPDFDRSDIPFCTWPELKALHTGGVFDIQSHTYAHARVFSDDAIEGFVSPDYQPHVHARPCVKADRPPLFLTAADLGAPLYPTRSRMSDVLRYDDPGARERARAAVARGGGAAFFARPDWERKLRRAVGAPTGRWETEGERERALVQDLSSAREELNSRLNTNTVKHICFPWAVAGAVAEHVARRVGYETAWADRLGGRHTVREGDNPFRLMRLKHKFIFCLPGRGRRFWG